MENDFGVGLSVVADEFDVNGTLAGVSFGSDAVGLSDGRFAIAWTKRPADSSADGWDIYARILNNDGTAAGDPILVNSITDNRQDNAAIAALPGGGFAVAWQDYASIDVPGSFNQIRLKVFDDQGVGQTVDVRANTSLMQTRWDPDIAGLNGDRIAVVWEDLEGTNGADTNGANSDLDGSAVNGQLFRLNGGFSGDEVTVNTTTTGSQSDTAVASLLGGGHVVVWSHLSGGNHIEIRGQKFDNAGNKVGDEVLIVPGPDAYSAPPEVSVLSNGNLIVTWLGSEVVAGVESSTVQAKLLDGNLNAMSDAFRVSTTTDGGRNDPDVAALDNGKSIIVWADSSETFNGFQAYGIRGQVIGSDGSLLGDELRLVEPDGYNLRPSVGSVDGDRFLVTWRDPEGNTSIDIGGKVFGIDAQDTGSQDAPSADALEVADFLKIAYEVFGEEISLANAALARDLVFDEAGEFLNGAIQGVYDYVHDTLWDLYYDNNIKYLLTFEASGSGTLIGAAASVTIDVADLMKISLEGRGGYFGNEAGKITTYTSQELRILDLNLPQGKASLSLTPIQFDPQQADLVSAFSADAAHLSFNSKDLFKGEYLQAGGPSSQFDSFGSIANVNGGLTVMSLNSGEVQGPEFDSNIELTSQSASFGKVKTGFSASVNLEDYNNGIFAPTFEANASYSPIGVNDPNFVEAPFGGYLFKMGSNSAPYEVERETFFSELLGFPHLSTNASISITDGMTGGLLADTLVGTQESDLIEGAEQSDHIQGEGGDDSLWGGSQFDFIQGGEGNDRITGGKHGALASGGSGDDVYYVFVDDDDSKGQDRLRIIDAGSNTDDDTLVVVMTPSIWGFGYSVIPAHVHALARTDGAKLHLDFYEDKKQSSTFDDAYFNSNKRLASITIFNQGFEDERIENLEFVYASGEAGDEGKTFWSIDLVDFAQDSNYFGNVTEIDRVDFDLQKAEYEALETRNDLLGELANLTSLYAGKFQKAAAVTAAFLSSDLDGDGVDDVPFFNPALGAVGYFLMPTGTWQSIGKAGAAWFALGTGNFDDDGTSDILWQNKVTGAVGMFDMDVGGYDWRGVSQVGEAWEHVGIGDFDGDGDDDVLWANSETNTVGQFQMTNGQSSWSSLGSTGSGWKTCSTGDFNGDGYEDILWNNSQTGKIGQFQMSESGKTWKTVSALGQGWDVAGSGDFNADGTDDILVINASTRKLGQFVMDHDGTTNWAGIGSFGAGWELQSIGDYNRDGRSDLLWRNVDTGTVGQYQMDGSDYTWDVINTAGDAWDVIA